MFELNDFERMCKGLYKKKCNPMCQSDYMCAKISVNKYVGDDRTKLLSLKSEAKKGDFIEFSTIILSILAVALSFFSIIIQIFGQGNDKLCCLTLVAFLAGGLIILVIITMYRFLGVYKWRSYILTAIEELEKEKFKK